VAAETVEPGHTDDLTDKLKFMNKFAFLATVPVVLLYWLAYFLILTKGESPPPEDDERSRLVGHTGKYT
jgi:hypothetical protein